MLHLTREFTYARMHACAASTRRSLWPSGWPRTLQRCGLHDVPMSSCFFCTLRLPLQQTQAPEVPILCLTLLLLCAGSRSASGLQARGQRPAPRRGGEGVYACAVHVLGCVPLSDWQRAAFPSSHSSHHGNPVCDVLIVAALICAALLHQAFTTERAQRSGRANAASGRIMVTIPNDHFGPIEPCHDPERGRVRNPRWHPPHD